jgi:dihydrofolate reductase
MKKPVMRKNNLCVSLIVAMAENRCIGHNNRMPWHISEDLKRFKTLTMGHPVIMGRKTFESILGYLNGPLPGRDNIVISRSGFTAPEGATVTSSVKNAINLANDIANKNNINEVFIMGGAQIYAHTLELADRLHLTKVHQSVDGDAFFPPLEESDWNETWREDHLDNDPPYSFMTLVRKTNST